MTAPGPPPGPPGPPQQPSNGMGLTSMILGIISIPACIGYGVIGLVLGVIAVVLGYLGKQKAEQGLATNRGQAMAGLITGIIGAALGLLGFVLVIAGVVYG